MPFSQRATRQVLNPRTSPVRFVLVSIALLVCTVGILCAQQPAPAPDRPDAPSATRNPPKPTDATIVTKSFFFPNIATSEEKLSTGGKFKLFVENSTSIGALVGAAAGAGIGQAETYPHGYREGAEGYGKRFGASLARNASNEFFGTFILASALHEDPRFFPQANPTFGGSIKYAVARVFVTRNDDGQKVANWSGLIGPAMGEGLANVYWPEGERTAGDTFERYGVDIAARAGFNFLRNYWPVIFKRLRGSSSN